MGHVVYLDDAATTHRPQVLLDAELTYYRQANANPSALDAYLTSRGVTPHTVRTFVLGCTQEGLLRGRIVIPIHNASGELIAYAGRAIDGQEPQYRFPAAPDQLASGEIQRWSREGINQRPLR